MSGSKKVFTTLGSSNHVPEEREAFADLSTEDLKKLINHD